MTSLFWLLWVINVLLLKVAIGGMGFRSSFDAGVDLNILIIVVLVVVLAGSLILRYSVKHKGISPVAMSIHANRPTL